jgi:EAL domain-containing protein (putative c-di-GMP-specific phosphodiesterase class I)
MGVSMVDEVLSHLTEPAPSEAGGGSVGRSEVSGTSTGGRQGSEPIREVDPVTGRGQESNLGAALPDAEPPPRPVSTARVLGSAAPAGMATDRPSSEPPVRTPGAGREVARPATRPFTYKEIDTIARLGGDEFAVIITQITQEEDVALVANKIIQTLSLVFSVGGYEVFITASIGINLYPGIDNDRGKLLENADVAMYHAKQFGRNNYKFYSAHMNAVAFERLMLETNLRRALERQEFRLYYQPQIDMQSGSVNGVEALIRWQHPDLGLVSPLEFIPLLEETGLILPVGEWVIRTACKQIREWLDAGFPPLTMAVNLSARQFRQPNLIEMIEQALNEFNIPPGQLELELTESVMMDNLEETVETLKKLKLLGLKIAIDDFGTGVSSLGYLKHFPIDTLKISHDFVLNLPADSADASIASAVISLARNMQLSSVAEGVENQGQLDFLRGQDCERMQGFLFSRPIPSDQMTTLLTNWQATSVK